MSETSFSEIGEWQCVLRRIKINDNLFEERPVPAPIEAEGFI